MPRVRDTPFKGGEVMGTNTDSNVHRTSKGKSTDVVFFFFFFSLKNIMHQSWPLILSFLDKKKLHS